MKQPDRGTGEAATRQLSQTTKSANALQAGSAVVGLPGSAAPGLPPVGVWVVLGLTLLLYVVLGVRTAGSWGLLGALGLVGGLLLAALGYDWPATLGQLLGICYGLAALYLMGYFAWLRRSERPAASPAERQAEYQRLLKAHAELGFVAWLFPVPLAAYWWWHQQRLHRLRYPATQPCPTCGQPLRRLTSSEAAAHLAPGQLAEIRLKSVAYYVWQCAAGHALVQEYLAPDKPATKCPACHFRTLLPRRQEEVLQATAHADGWGWSIAQCAFCQHERKAKYTIPHPEQNADSHAGSSDSSGSWSSSSGSSSDSATTSSGGVSGGGGAGSSW